jgi:thioredoxin reductase (NADPH)
VPLLLGSPAIASLRAEEPTRVGRLDAADFRELVSGCVNLNARLMATMATRVERLQQVQSSAPVASVTLVGHRYDIACHALRDFLARNHVSYRWQDLREQGTPEPDARFPALILADGRRLETPTFRAAAQALGLATEPGPGVYDVTVIGGGPAGLAAAVYGASEGLRTLLVERHAPGGQAGTSSRIENYLGFPSGIGGDELGTRALRRRGASASTSWWRATCSPSSPATTRRRTACASTGSRRCRRAPSCSRAAWRGASSRCPARPR